jgi:hypothetical protein
LDIILVIKCSIFRVFVWFSTLWTKFNQILMKYVNKTKRML